MTVEGMNSGVATDYSPAFINYVENIYVGYKFYETADAEGVIDYDNVVQFPFGHGLSYTTFTQTMGDLKETDGTISFDVTVTNTGDTAGKDVVEVYYNPPYTNGGIEKATANLIAYDKTDLLDPGASQTMTISFDAEEMASYDEHGHGCYVLEEGDYIISINEDSHTILDSELSSLNIDVARGEWGFRGFIVSDIFRNNGHGFMNADMALANGVDAMLSTFAGGPNQVTDKNAASNVIYMRRAMHNILYTTANSWAYDDEHQQNTTPTWKKAAYAIDIAAALLAAWAVMAVKKYKKQEETHARNRYLHDFRQRAG